MKPLLAAFAVFVVIASTRADEDAGNELSIEFVRSLQTPGGGFVAMAPEPNIRLAPTLRATSSAVRALHYLGGKLPNPDGAAKFIAECHDPKSGGFADRPGGMPDVATTAIGIMTVRDLDMPVAKYVDGALKFLTDNAKTFEDIRIAAAAFERLERPAPKKSEWRDEVLKRGNGVGGFGAGHGKARETASAAVTLLRLGDKLVDRDGVLKVIREGQRPNGGFGKADSELNSDLETCYRVMRCFMMLKNQPDRVEGLRTYVAKCRNEDGGYGISPGEPSTVGATYYAVMIRKWLD